MRELIENAFTGVNIIPTVLLILSLIYWLTVIIGIIDLDFFDFGLDGDLGNSMEGFQSILVFFNLKEIPIMVLTSVISLVFWILAMFLKILPIPVGGLINGLLLVPLFIASLFVAKLITIPLKGIFKESYNEIPEIEEEVVGRLVNVLCDIKDNRLGQAEIEREGANILINVKAEFKEDTFYKNEEAYVSKKNYEKNIYYIVKTYNK
ncbi:hypothetical protein [Clostridium sp. D53t1_180928_C8]|uniref:hypothetical protein n=1 Tax=Clostridium sp. D53t1_180928_C8 TaxID=2787101 RepID=UPI0018A9CB72|nr:hypothetical protein [Clostridium sp. D53t1_180928_C8]